MFRFVSAKHLFPIIAFVILVTSSFTSYTHASESTDKYQEQLRVVAEKTAVLWQMIKAWEGWEKGVEFVQHSWTQIRDFSVNSYTFFTKNLQNAFISRSQREFPKREPNNTPRETFIPAQEPNYRGRISFDSNREISMVQDILRNQGAVFSDLEVEKMLVQARQYGSSIPSEAMPDIVYNTTSTSNGFISTTPVSPSQVVPSQGKERYEIQTWTVGRRSVPVGDTFPIEVYWRAILWGADDIPILVEEPKKHVVYIDGSNHRVASCVNVYADYIPLPSRYGVDRVYFEHIYESYAGQPARYTGQSRNDGCSVTSAFGSNFVLDISAAEFELLVRVVQAEAKGEGYEGMLAVAASIVARAKTSNTNGFRGRDTLADVIYQPNQYEPITEGLFMHSSNDPYSNNNAYRHVSEMARRAALEALHGNPGPIPLRNGTEPAMYFYNPDIARNKCFHRTLDFAMKLGDHAFFYHNDKSWEQRLAECEQMQMYNHLNELIPEERRHQCDVVERRARGERDPMFNPNYTIWCNMETYGI